MRNVPNIKKNINQSFAINRLIAIVKTKDKQCRTLQTATITQ